MWPEKKYQAYRTEKRAYNLLYPQSQMIFTRRARKAITWKFVLNLILVCWFFTILFKVNPAKKRLGIFHMLRSSEYLVINVAHRVVLVSNDTSFGAMDNLKKSRL